MYNGNFRVSLTPVFGPAFSSRQFKVLSTWLLSLEAAGRHIPKNDV